MEEEDQEAAVPTMIANKLKNMLQIAFFTVRKGVFNSKKRGKIIGKAFNELMLEHQSSFSCQSHDTPLSFVSPISCRPSDVDLAFVSPREYEFSCTSSSPNSHIASYNKYCRKRHHDYPRKSRARARYYHHAPPYVWTNGNDDVALSVTGGGCGGGDRDGLSPLVRPFQVDMEAEKFIQRFYSELRLQKWMSTAQDSGYNYY